jgi:hypothetical protein
VYVSNPNHIMVAYWSGDGDFSATLYSSIPKCAVLATQN